MRRGFLFLLLLGLLLAVPAAEATLERTGGSEYLQLRNGHGSAKVRNRGNLLGHVGRGHVVATANVTVSGWERRRAVSASVIEYRGRDLSFRTSSPGKWRLRLTGRNIDASGFVRGCVTLDGVDSAPPGDFRVGVSGPLRPWPRTAARYSLGSGC